MTIILVSSYLITSVSHTHIIIKVQHFYDSGFILQTVQLR
jgi:hypothetical protein